MKKKKFIPADWLSSSSPSGGDAGEHQSSQKDSSANGDSSAKSQSNADSSAGASSKSNSSSEASAKADLSAETLAKAEVIYIISQIEARRIDLTASYNDWLTIGFAFSEAFGEEGRTFFHRVSSFYPGYSEQECNKQFDNCLKSSGSGVTLKSFFHLAKMAGIDIYPSNPENPQDGPLPSISVEVYDNLPRFLAEILNVTNVPQEKDLLLLGTLVTLSSCMPNIYGIYHNRKVHPNLYCFVVALPSSGKGILTHCKPLVNGIHTQLRRESRELKEAYDRDLNHYNNSKKKNPDAEKPPSPPVKLLFIPANSSASGMFQLLHDNEGCGLIFETEGDTLSNTFKTDYGNYSDGFRKAFHHEAISFFRRAENEYVSVEFPKLSALLSGTPNQVTNLIPDSENGLFSRFMFYYLDFKPVWVDVFEQFNYSGLDSYFAHLGEQFQSFYDNLTGASEIAFSFNPAQKQTFNDTFSELQTHYHHLLGMDYLASVRRLGLISFRIAMVLSTLRLMDTGELPTAISCDDVDFNNAISITKTLMIHGARIFSNLPVVNRPQNRKNQVERFFELLPQTFSRQDYLTIAATLNIPVKTADGYINRFIKQNRLHRDKHDQYLKPPL